MRRKASRRGEPRAVAGRRRGPALAWPPSPSTLGRFSPRAPWASNTPHAPRPVSVAEAPPRGAGVDWATARVNRPSALQPTCVTMTSCSARTAAPACRTSAAPARAATPACAASSPAATPPRRTAAWTATARPGPPRAPPPCSAACCCWGWPPAWAAEPGPEGTLRPGGGPGGSRARGPAPEAGRREGCGPSCSQVLHSRALPPPPAAVSGTCPRPGTALRRRRGRCGGSGPSRLRFGS